MAGWPPLPVSVYGVPYMDSELDPVFQVTLRGFSRSELAVRAKRQCALHFGAEGFRVEEQACVPCVCSLGGRVRLYEAHFVATPVATLT